MVLQQRQIYWKILIQSASIKYWSREKAQATFVLNRFIIFQIWNEYQDWNKILSLT